MKTFQPCPLCGNCGFFKRSKKEHGKVVEPANCRVTAIPNWEPSGDTDERTGRLLGVWGCENFTKKKNGNKKTRNVKPWQQRGE